jgi:sporulation protein YlmC with PRC-barrel domain
MRTKLLAAAATAALAAGPALAQDVLVSSQGPNELRADWIVGANVTSTQGETIGSIQDIILDGDEGDVTAAVVSVGGFLGFGAKNIAVDWNELQIDWDGNEITLNLTREQADEAEEYVFRDQDMPPPPPPEPAAGGGGTMGGGTAPAPGATGGGALD